MECGRPPKNIRTHQKKPLYPERGGWKNTHTNSLTTQGLKAADINEGELKGRHTWESIGYCTQ